MRGHKRGTRGADQAKFARYEGVQPVAANDTPELPGLSACRAIGIEEVPTGFASLTKKQQQFVLAYLRTGIACQAAKEAGYADPESEGSITLHSPKVQAVIAQAALPLAKNADRLIERAANRSRALHELFIEAVNKPEGLRSTNEILKRADACAKADGLLGTLLGKIQPVSVTNNISNNVAGGTSPTVTMVPASFLPVLANMRREVVARQLAKN